MAAAPTVALVGTLQSELGCPADWAPDCPATELVPVPGEPDLYRATFDVPAGTWQYKVALNDSWDVNYGAAGVAGGGDITLTTLEIAGNHERVDEWLGGKMNLVLDDLDVEWVAPHGQPGVVAAVFTTPSGVVRI